MKQLWEQRLLWTGAALLCGLATGCSRPASGSAGPGGPPARAAKVRVATIVEEEVAPEIIVVGTIVSRRTSEVASGAEGKVDEFTVREGDLVEAGQLLSTLNMVTTDLGIAEAEKLLAERQSFLEELEKESRPEVIAEAKARMEASAVTMKITLEKFKRMDRIVRDSGGSRNDLDDAQEKFEAAEKMHAAAEANHALAVAGAREETITQARARRDAQSDQVNFLKAEKEKRLTRAPFAGVIMAEHTQQGQWLSKGDLVVTLADILEEVHAIANIDERDLPNLQIGSRVTVEIEATSKRNWDGEVIAIVPRSQWEAGSRTFPVKVAIKNEVIQAGTRRVPLLTEGMIARMRFQGPKVKSILVPKDAVVRSEAGSTIYAVLGDPTANTGKAQPIVMREGAFFGDKVQAIASDLTPGTRVVIEGAERLQPFADLEILPALTTGPPGAPAKPAAAK